MKHPTPREQRKKLLLVQGAMYRLECMQAQRELRTAVSGNVITNILPRVLRSVFSSKLGLVFTTLAPVLLGSGKGSRFMRRLVLLAGGATAAWAALQAWLTPQTDEKNPDHGRD